MNFVRGISCQHGSNHEHFVTLKRNHSLFWFYLFQFVNVSTGVCKYILHAFQQTRGWRPTRHRWWYWSDGIALGVPSNYKWPLGDISKKPHASQDQNCKQQDPPAALSYSHRWRTSCGCYQWGRYIYIVKVVALIVFTIFVTLDMQSLYEVHVDSPF